jgi:hypothetical protein
VVEDGKPVKIERAAEKSGSRAAAAWRLGNDRILASTPFQVSGDSVRVESLVPTAPVNETFTPPSHS